MRKLILLTLLLFLFPLASIAQTKDTEKEEPEKPAEEAAEKPAEEEGTTRANRGKSLLYVGISPLGVHIPTLATTPIQVGVFLGKHFYVGGEFGKFNFSIDEDSNSVDADYTNIGVVTRWFPGDTFYFSLAGHKRTWDAEATIPLSTGTTAKANLDADVTLLTLGVGSQWIADFGLTFGVDWFVFSSILNESSSGTIATGGLSAPEISETEQEIADLGDFLNFISAFPGAFIISIGWSF